MNVKGLGKSGKRKYKEITNDDIELSIKKIKTESALNVTQRTQRSNNNSDDSKYVLKKFSDQQANNESKLPIELTNKTDTNLHDLNEDCLLEIFEVDSLTLVDLCSLAETCTRFQQIVQRVFPTKLEIESYEDVYCVTSSKSSSKRKDQLLKKQRDDKMEIILRNCGPNLCDISIAGRCLKQSKEKFLLKLVSMYCVDSLECPDVNCIKSPEVLTLKSKPIFDRLQVLHLQNIDIANGFESSALFDSLIELRVDDVKGYMSILEMTFPKLERFYFTNYQTINSSLEAFISRHPILKTLDVSAEISKKYRTAFLQGIGKHCQEMKKLSLIYIENSTEICSMLPLQSLKRLETLELGYIACKDFSFVQAMTNLRELCLYSCYPPQGDQLVYLTQLTKLRINNDSIRHHLDVVDIIRRLINLEEFKIFCRYFTMKEKEFSEIVGIVTERPHPLTLTCNFKLSYNFNNSDENQRLRLVQYI